MTGIDRNNIKEKVCIILPWICVGIIGLVFIFLFSYTDQINTVRQSIEFTNEILKGNFTGGYQAVIDLVGTEGNWDIPAAYEPFTYIIVGIFSFPIVLLYHFGFIDLPLMTFNRFGQGWFALYVKMQQLLLIAGTALTIYNICKVWGKDKDESKNGVLYFVSGTSFLYYALAIGQMEIYVVFFSMLGILYWLKKDNKKFILCFALAIPIKMFALMIFFPLILIREKRIWKVIVNLLSGCSIWIILKLLFHSNAAYRLSVSEPNQRMLDTIFAKQLSGGNSGVSAIPIFLMLYILVCLCVYFIKSKKFENYFAVFIPFVIYALLFCFVGHYPYWIVLITPLLPLIMVWNPEKRDGNMLIATIVGICYNITIVFYHTWAFNAKTCIDTSFTPVLFGRRILSEIKHETVADIFQNTVAGKLVPAFTAFYVAGFLWLIIYNMPLDSLKNKIISLKIKGVIFFRIFAIVPFLILTFAAYYSIKDVNIINTAEGTPMTSGWNLVSETAKEYGKNLLVQKVEFDKEYDLTKLKLFFRRSGNTFAAYCSLDIQFVNLDTNEVLYSYRIGYNELAWESFSVFDLHGIHVEPDTQYAVRVYPEDAQESSPINICLTENDVLPGSNAEYMGGDSGHDLYMVIEGKTQE